MTFVLTVGVCLYVFFLWFIKCKLSKSERRSIDGFGLVMMLIFCIFWPVVAPFAIISFGFHSLAKFLKS